MTVAYCKVHARLFDPTSNVWISGSQAWDDPLTHHPRDRCHHIAQEAVDAYIEAPRTDQGSRQRTRARCGVLLDVACAHEGCPEHHNDRLGDVCRYCATNERATQLPRRDLSRLFLATLEGV